jgi:hypothetical protein
MKRVGQLGCVLLVDWQTVAKNHIHMTVRGRGKA